MSETLDLKTAEGRAAARSLGMAVPAERPMPCTRCFGGPCDEHAHVGPAGKTHVLVFDGLLPRLNEVRGRHWSKEANAKSRLKERLVLCALAQHIPQATGPRSVFLDVALGPNRKRPDADAYDKILLDALVTIGLLLDDSARGLVGRVGISFERGPASETRICLTDVEAP
jgi:hypothetical protein